MERKEPGLARRKLDEWLLNATDNTRSLHEGWQMVRAWKAGALPETHDELLNWVRVIENAKRRNRKQMKALVALEGILAAKLTERISIRSLARILGVSHGTAQNLTTAGRKFLADLEREREVGIGGKDEEAEADGQGGA